MIMLPNIWNISPMPIALFPNLDADGCVDHETTKRRLISFTASEGLIIKEGDCRKKSNGLAVSINAGEETLLELNCKTVRHGHCHNICLYQHNCTLGCIENFVSSILISDTSFSLYFSILRQVCFLAFFD